MLCKIGDTYYLADGSRSGGQSLTGLRLAMHRYFDVVIPLPESITRAPLMVGMAYKIVIYVTGDDFTNIGGTNTTGAIFIATGTTPATWAPSASILVALSPALIDRNKRRVEINFSVQRVQDTIADAENFCLEHEFTVPRTGDINLIATPSPSLPFGISALIVNGELISHELVRQIGKFTEHAYRIVGSPIFAPTPEEDVLVTEGGDTITTEGGDALIVE